MRALTSHNIHRDMAILLDGKAITAPTIQSTIAGSGQITLGMPSARNPAKDIQQQGQLLVQTLNAGSLPATLQSQPISVQTIGATLGADNLKAGLRSAVIAVIVVLGFMFIYYTITGLFADVALMLNLLLTLGVMALLHATFTLPGIAGVVLTLGMAVDANILINERIREEIHKGASLWLAVKQGYDRVFWTIFDANLTTSLTSIVLEPSSTKRWKMWRTWRQIGYKWVSFWARTCQTTPGAHPFRILRLFVYFGYNPSHDAV
jgi:protein-export membrane protein SecD